MAVFNKNWKNFFKNRIKKINLNSCSFLQFSDTGLSNKNIVSSLFVDGFINHGTYFEIFEIFKGFYFLLPTSILHNF